MADPCQVCGNEPATGEGVFMFGRTPEALMAAAVRFADDLEAWPSVWCCDACTDATTPVFRALDNLPAADLMGITSPLLVTICRLATGHDEDKWCSECGEMRAWFHDHVADIGRDDD